MRYEYTRLEQNFVYEIYKKKTIHFDKVTKQPNVFSLSSETSSLSSTWLGYIGVSLKLKSKDS